jgi:hypothetical protein
MRRVKKLTSCWLAAGAVLLALSIPAIAQDSSSGLVAKGDPPAMFLLYTGDVIGYIEPCG